MFGRKSGVTVDIFLPVRIGEGLAETALAKPLDASLSESGLGRVDDFNVARDVSGEPEALILRLRMATAAPRGLKRVTKILEALDAPIGSVLTIAGGTERLTFGVSEGLAIYLSGDDDAGLEVAEICTDEMAGEGLYQGSARLGGRMALYFYGASYSRMRSAITFAMDHDPRFEGAEVRRLT